MATATGELLGALVRAFIANDQTQDTRDRLTELHDKVRAEAGEDVTPNDDESGDALDHLGVEKTGEDHL